MSLPDVFGIGADQILAQNISVRGTVVDVKSWWFLKMNTKTVRRNALDGASFPNRVLFNYEVDGKAYSGSWVIPPSVSPPAVGDQVTVFYDPDDPRRYALRMGSR